MGKPKIISVIKSCALRGCDILKTPLVGSLYPQVINLESPCQTVGGWLTPRFRLFLVFLPKCHTAPWLTSLLPCKIFTSFSSFSANMVCFDFGSTNHITRFYIDSFGYFPRIFLRCEKSVLHFFFTLHEC